MLNQITIAGRLTRDPELRHTANGTAVASFALAVDRDYTSKDGGERETDFVDIVAWRGTAEFVSKYFTKGQLAIVNRQTVFVNCTAKSALCPTNPVSTSLYITGDGATGEVVAVEMVPNVPGQQDMFGEEQEAAPILKMVRNA